jgi:hypothetical protein
MSFKLLYGSGAEAKLPASLPANYPLTDFYGDAISGGGATGAVQASTAQGGYYLALSVNDTLRGSVTASPPPDADGLYPAGSIITASPNSGYSLRYWLVNGVKTNAAPTSLSSHTWVQAVFGRVLTVNVFTDGLESENTPGTLRHALTNAQEDDIITLNGVTAGTTKIELASRLPTITKNLTIEGNGVTLTRAASWTASDSYSQLLRITTTAEVQISRVHFKDGLATDGGGAVYNTGILTLESCIFSDNQITASGASGGAICSYNNTLTIRGCTFYGNSSGYYGGAVYFPAEGKTLTLTGNLFYGNTAVSGYPVVDYWNSGTVSASYNVVDAAFGTGSAQAGWAAGTGDMTISALPVSSLSFKPLYGSEAGARLPAALPVGYPVIDFYGDPISGGGAAGAVQGSTAHGSGYYYLEISVNNSLGGSVTVNSTLDDDGLCPAGSIITANPNSGYSFGYWLVNGVKTGTATLSLSAHSRVQAVFNRAVTVNVFTDGPGSETTPGTLRYALGNAEDGDIITLNGVTAGITVIELESALPVITKSLTIEGNGVTLTRAVSWTIDDSYSQLLRITGTTAEVLIRRLYFKDGLARGDGGAIYNIGILTLESCIFSSNRTTVTYVSYSGGAIYSNNTLTIRGCTFYGNAGYHGGAVYFSGWPERTLTLTGNLFYGNTTASDSPVVYNSNGTVNASYNMVDVAFGTGSAQAGWAAGTGDTTTATLPVSPLSFRLLYGSDAGAKLPAALTANYPLTDFYGDTISGGGAAGAVQASTAQGSGYYYLGLSVNDTLGGSVTVSPAAPDADGLCPAGSVITANPNSGYVFVYWLVNGVTAGTAPLNFSAHSHVQAVFGQLSTITDITYSSVSGGTWTLQSDGRRKSPAISHNGVTKARVSFTSTGADADITIALDVSSESGYDFAFISTLDNASATYDSGYYTGSRISGTQSVSITIPVPTAGSHFVDIGYRKDSSESTGSDCAWFKVIE